MIICGSFGIWEILLVLVVLIVFLLPASRMLMGRRGNMTEKLDQIERLERLLRDGSLTKRQFNRQKSKILRGR
jgi:hypothetical protein